MSLFTDRCADDAIRVATMGEPLPMDPLFERDVRLAELPRGRRLRVHAARGLAAVASVAAAWMAARIVDEAPAWAAIACAATVAAAWCGWLELRGPRAR